MLKTYHIQLLPTKPCKRGVAHKYVIDGLPGNPKAKPPKPGQYKYIIYSISAGPDSTPLAESEATFETVVSAAQAARAAIDTMRGILGDSAPLPTSPEAQKVEEQKRGRGRTSSTRSKRKKEEETA